MSTQFTEAFLKKIPKTDLHLHLDGSLRIPTLIEMANDGGIDLPSQEEAGLRELVFKDTYQNLPEYLAGFQYTCAVMQNAENLERIAFELAEDNLAEGVRYIEVRFAPQLHIHEQLSFEQVIDAVTKGLERAKTAHNKTVVEGEDIPFEYGIIVCALRYFNEHMSSYYNSLFKMFSYASDSMKFAIASEELARAAVTLRNEKGLPIVGFDLAGAEAGFPAGDHTAAFEYAHSHFLKKTVHAGEAYGPESIFQAITDCHANRIGHGTFLFMPDKIQDDSIEHPDKYSHFLAQYIATERITIEVNLTSNLQTTPSIKSVADHPLRQMLEQDLSVSICTDNRLMSNTTVTHELQLAVDELPVSRTQLRNMIVAGFKGSFYRGSYNEKRAYVRSVLQRYATVEEEFADQLPE